MKPEQDITGLLHAYRDGDREAFDRLIPMVYGELRRLAHRHLQGPARGRSLNTTALVHEVYLKMSDQQGLEVKDRDHFLAVTACAMRQVIIQFARARGASKRGRGERPVTLDEERITIDEQADRLLAINEALDGLRQHSERLAQVVECRFFAGLSEKETSRALEVSERTVQRDWMRARAWLRDSLEAGDELRRAPVQS